MPSDECSVVGAAQRGRLRHHSFLNIDLIMAQYAQRQKLREDNRRKESTGKMRAEEEQRCCPV